MPRISLKERISGGVFLLDRATGTQLIARGVQVGKCNDYLNVESADVIVYAEPNAGKPELVEDQAVYKVSPEDFAATVEKIHSVGVNIIGGCCGTEPGHITAVSRKLRTGD